jgi:hypothetical protein
LMAEEEEEEEELEVVEQEKWSHPLPWGMALPFLDGGCVELLLELRIYTALRPCSPNKIEISGVLHTSASLWIFLLQSWHALKCSEHDVICIWSIMIQKTLMFSEMLQMLHTSMIFRMYVVVVLFDCCVRKHR